MISFVPSLIIITSWEVDILSLNPVIYYRLFGTQASGRTVLNQLYPKRPIITPFYNLH